eukprot:1195890-Prorocentrum_minimum.AAC.6
MDSAWAVRALDAASVTAGIPVDGNPQRGPVMAKTWEGSLGHTIGCPRHVIRLMGHVAAHGLVNSLLLTSDHLSSRRDRARGDPRLLPPGLLLRSAPSEGGYGYHPTTVTPRRPRARHRSRWDPRGRCRCRGAGGTPPGAGPPGTRSAPGGAPPAGRGRWVR